ncbi:MAG TPA: GH32 C-terminal domain-containing protein, partial [Clostridia bacterium]|nr:GH32 C-terminal domain-containing protein [Clostridia bacterium]
PQDFGAFALHGSRKPLDLGAPALCEIQAEVCLQGAAQAGLAFSTADGSEALLYYDDASGELVFDASKSGGAVREPVERAPFKLSNEEALRLTVYVDGCVLEIFANDRQAISRRIYWKDLKSLRIEAFADGKTQWRVTAYEMAASNPY